MKDEIVLYQPDATIQLEVRLQDETVWLTQQQMAELFDTDRTSILRHIHNIYGTHELEEKATCAKIAQVRLEGNRRVMREIPFYNLDMIISVGYRVNSIRGTQFRRWATSVLKEYMLRGYAVNQRLIAMEDRMDRKFQEHADQIHELQSKVDFFVRTSLPPMEQVFFGGQFFEARVLLERIIKTAKRRVVIIDGYVDAATFEMMDVRTKGVQATIYSGKDLTGLRDLHNGKTGTEPIETAVWSRPSHDRWLIVDESVYHCGHSLKDMGQKLSAVSLLGIDPNDILKQVI